MNKVVMPYNVSDLQRLYENTNSGYWFSKEAMDFFNSRVTKNYKRLDDSTALFISTEKYGSGEKRYATIRIAKLESYIREDGRKCQKLSISTFGSFNMLSLYTAKKKLEELTLKDVE